MGSPRRRRSASTLRAPTAVPASLNSASTLSVCPPWRDPLSAARPAATTSHGEALAEATQRAVKAETFSSWSAARISAAPIGPATSGRPGAQPNWRSAAMELEEGGYPAATPAMKRRMRAPVAATAAGRRSQAARSCAPARGTAIWQRSMGVNPPGRGQAMGGVSPTKRRPAPPGSPRPSGAAPPPTGGRLAREEAPGLSRISRPEQRRHLLDGRGPRQLHRVPAAVVEPAVLDQRQRGLQHRHPPGEGLRRRLLRCLFRIPAQLLLLLEPQHVLPWIALRPPLPPQRLRVEHPPAGVGVERRQRDPQLRGGLLGGQKAVVHDPDGITAHIDFRIKIDNLMKAGRRWDRKGEPQWTPRSEKDWKGSWRPRPV